MGKTSDLFNKIGDIKRTIQAKIGTIKDRSGMDLTRSRRYLKKKGVKNIQKNYMKKVLMTWIITMVWSLT